MSQQSKKKLPQLTSSKVVRRGYNGTRSGNEGVMLMLQKVIKQLDAKDIPLKP